MTYMTRDRKYTTRQAMIGSAIVCTVFVWIPLGLIALWGFAKATGK